MKTPPHWQILFEIIEFFIYSSEGLDISER